MFRRLEASRRVPGTRIVENPLTPRIQGPPDDALWLAHERIPFVSYPHEWPSELLFAAGKLTLLLAREAVDAGLTLKDATPYNVVFEASRPIFVDILSFERRDPHDPSWMPYSQFCHTFLLPLLLEKQNGIPARSWFWLRRDGPTLRNARDLAGPLQRMSPLFASLVTLPAALERKAGSQGELLYSARRTKDVEQAAFIVKSLIGGLEKRLDSVRPTTTPPSAWIHYGAEPESYSPEQFKAKENAVRSMLAQASPEWVLDIGCNTGHFSRMAAEIGAQVVAMDSDGPVVAETWKRASDGDLPIYSVCGDLARPTPALGWMNQESESLIGRLEARFDTVLALAVVHHLAITEGIPLDHVLRLLARMSRRHVLVEYVGPADPQFRRLRRGRNWMLSDLTEAGFVGMLNQTMRVVRRVPIPGLDRTLFLAETRAL